MLAKQSCSGGSKYPDRKRALQVAAQTSHFIYQKVTAMLSLSSPPVFIRGAAHGINGSFFKLSIDVNGELNETSFSALREEINAADFGQVMEQPKTPSAPDVMASILEALGRIIQLSGQPFPVQYIQNEQGPTELRYLLRAPQHLQQSIVHYLRLCLSGTVSAENFQGDKKNHWSALAIGEGGLRKHLNRFSGGPPTPYSLHLLRAATARNIPCTQIEGETWRLGIGCHARMTTGTMSDQTGVVGVNFARNKMAMARLLERNGLPNLGGVAASTPAQAVKAAQKLGFPVVVKPLALDGGIGVACDLKDESQVEKHATEVLKKDKHVIVQRFLLSQDYRATVVNGDVIWLVKRVPGGVIGDGEQSIRQLINAINAQSNRGNATHLPLKPLRLDAEARRYIKSNNLTMDSVIPKGEYLQLKGAANIASGGHHVPTLEHAHPDNIRLASLAADTFRLDFAGVDLLLPDITRSYRETGGAVCEVNAQPAIVPAKLYVKVVDALVSGDGRIPIIFLVGEPNSGGVKEIVTSIIRNALPGLGVVTKNGVSIDDEVVAASKANCFDDLEVLFNKLACRRILCVIDQDSYIKHGLPIATIDGIFVTGDGSSGPHLNTLTNVLNVAHRHVKGPISVPPDFEVQLPSKVNDLRYTNDTADQTKHILALLNENE